MGNGTVTSKFRFYPKDTTKSLHPEPEGPSFRFHSDPIKSNESDVRNEPKPSAPADPAPSPTLSKDPVPAVAPPAPTSQPSETSADSDKTPIEFPTTHHSSNCIRCYRLKKKCTRTYPKCSNCTKSGSSCEYINRPQKRKLNQAFRKISFDGDSPVDDKKSQIFRIVSENPGQKPEKVDVVAHKLVSISSLLSNEDNIHEEKSEKFDQINVSQRNEQFKPVVEKELPANKGQRIASLLNNKSWPVEHSQTDIKDDFVTIKTIENEDLPMAFVTTYFQNYEHLYPFIDKDEFTTNFKKIDFKNEAIINLDVYLLMCIGCLIYDANNNKKHFQDYFSDKIIESIINILHFNNLEKDVNLESINLLLLICVFAINLFNLELCWSAVGILDRLVVKVDYFKPQTKFATLKERFFWSIYNIDKELSILLDKPSQLPHDDFIELTLPLTAKLSEKDESDTSLLLVNAQISLHKFQNEVLSLKLASKSSPSPERLKQLSSDLEKWRVTTSLAIHSEFAGSPHLQESIGFVNLNYYYLLIELDQVSSTESFQFTLQFLSCSFSLLLSTTTKDGEQGKPNIKISLHSLFWYKKLFKVIHYNLESLLRIVEQKEAHSLKVSEFNGNFQLMINLLRYLSQSDVKPQEYATVLDKAVTSLNSLSVKLMNYGPEDDILKDIQDFDHLLCSGV